MPSKPPGKKPTKLGTSGTDDVEAFLASLDHPFKREILALRQIILGADSSIAEGIKWNAPSFRTSEYFATFQLRAKDVVQIILHLGAKNRANTTVRDTLTDAGSLLEWLAKDRASVKFTNLKEVEAKRPAFVEVIRQWIKHV